MAVQWQLLIRNPADAASPPTPEDKEMSILTEAQSVELFEAAEGTRLHVPVLLASCAGLRRGEVLGIQWSDLDWKTGNLQIRRSLEETKISGVRFKHPKSKRGRRPVALPAFVLRLLIDHKEKQDEIRSVLKQDYQANDLICYVEDGSIWKPSAFTSAYRALLRRRKLPMISFHSLRHSHASGLLRNGVDMKVISSRLGHSRVGFTADTYIHLVPEQDQDGAKKTPPP